MEPLTRGDEDGNDFLTVPGHDLITASLASLRTLKNTQRLLKRKRTLSVFFLSRIYVSGPSKTSQERRKTA